MKRKQDAMDADSFARWSDRVERRFRKVVLLLIILLIAAQTALQSPTIRHWLSPTDRAEGIAYDADSG